MFFRPQLYDILGYVQTDDSHAAVSKAIYLDKEDDLDYNERYLWALSFSPWPNPNIVEDLLKKFVKNNNLANKIKETIILTIASMTRKLSKLPYGNAKVCFKDVLLLSISLWDLSLDISVIALRTPFIVSPSEDFPQENVILLNALKQSASIRSVPRNSILTVACD